MLVFLFLLGLVTGFIGTNTGGSSFITVPTMVYLNIPIHSAIATARIASTGTMVSGLWQFHKSGKIDYRVALPASFFGLLGAICGGYILLNLPESLMKKVIAIIILTFSALSFFKKERNNSSADISKKKKYLGYISFILIGILGGIFGGQALLATYVYLLIFNKTMSESVGTRKVTGLVISLTSLLIYGVHGLINWKIGSYLIGGTLIGSYIGSSFALRKGDRWMQNLFTVVVIIVCARLFLGS